MGKIEVKKIINENIFFDDFKSLESNNIIEFFPKGKNNTNGLALVYAPNGSGKTTLSKMLDSNTKSNGEIEINYYNKEGVSSKLDSRVKVIFDQNFRNIIEGDTSEFIISQDIVKITQLEKEIISNFIKVADEVKGTLRDKYKISTVTNLKLEKLGALTKDLKDIINNKKNHDQIGIKNFINEIDKLSVNDISKELQIDKFNFILENYNKKNELIDLVLNINLDKIVKNTGIKEIEEKELAVNILNKYEHKEECIVCDNKINTIELKELKLKQCELIKNKLDKYYKDKIDKIVKKCNENDSFRIKEVILDAIESGNVNGIKKLQEEILIYISLVKVSIINDIIEIVNKSSIKSNILQIEELVAKQPTIEGEDIIFLEEIISNNLDKKLNIRIDPQNNKKIKLTLDGEEIIGVERGKLKLSNGEQNFISLAFEFMRARNVEEDIIVIDDPISSFDSIYKNKIIYCINSLSEDKECLILTHNIDLIKLMEAQGGKFNLYIFNNKEDGDNGFIPIYSDEKDIILKLNKLNDLFRFNIQEEVIDNRLFLIAMIPYMRGYANIIGNIKCYKELCNVMHWQRERVKVNLSKIYNELFINLYNVMSNDNGKDRINKLCCIEEEVSVDFEDIITVIKEGIEDIKIFKENTKYKLLNKTLRHTLIYLALRINVERVLMPLSLKSKCIRKKLENGKSILLGEIIREALKDEKQMKVFFMSRKTLVNDFNHFEGNMDIFQPAIDIKDKALKKEYVDIMGKLSRIEEAK